MTRHSKLDLAYNMTKIVKIRLTIIVYVVICLYTIKVYPLAFICCSATACSETHHHLTNSQCNEWGGEKNSNKSSVCEILQITTRVIMNELIFKHN